MQFSMYDSVFAHWKENNISIILFKFLMVKSFSILRLELWCNNFCLSLVETSFTNNKYLLIFKTSYSSESFSFWTFRKVNSTVVNSFDLGMAKVLLFKLLRKSKIFTSPRYGFALSADAQRIAITSSHTKDVLLNFGKKQILLEIYFAISLERRWSSHTFRYGYLVTTSPQLPTLP